MEVTKQAIVKTNCFKSAIKSAISEFFNDSYAAECLESLSFTENSHGGFGLFVEEGSYYSTSSNYFFATKIHGQFFRVEYCCEITYLSVEEILKLEKAKGE